MSKVLNGRAGVAAGTRRRVEALLREHGYRRPEAIAPAAIVEVVFYGLERHMAIEIMRGVEPVAREHEPAVGFTEVVEPTSPGRTWAEMGATAARMLVALAAGDTPVQTRVELATTLVVRDSTAPPVRP